MAMALEAKHKEEQRIVEIISLVNDNFEGKLWKVLGVRSFLKSFWINIFSFVFYFLTLVLLLILIAQLSKPLTSSLAQFTPEIALTLSFALIAVLIAVLNLSINISNVPNAVKPKTDIITENFKKMKGKVEVDEHPLLKVLIIMKSKHPEIDLQTFLDKPKELMNKERLLQILYLQ
jgi:hypothetical protein